LGLYSNHKINDVISASLKGSVIHMNNDEIQDLVV